MSSDWADIGGGLLLLVMPAHTSFGGLVDQLAGYWDPH